jgi:ribosome biogenesis GTPase A
MGSLSSHCPGCGALFQQEFPQQAGYLPPMQRREEVTEEEIKRIQESKDPLTPREVKILLQKDKVIVCKRCHSFKSGLERSVSLKSNRIQFKEVKQRNGGLIVLVLDLVDLPGSMIHDLSDYVGIKDMIVVLNKADLMPSQIDMSKVISYVGSQAFTQHALDIFPMSAKDGSGLSTLASHLAKRFHQNEDCYLVGAASSGKSTILNQLKHLIGDKRLATTSRQGGTTVGMIRISSKQLLPAIRRLEDEEASGDEVKEIADDTNPLAPERYLYDTAGIIQTHQLLHLFGEKELSYFSPSTKMIVTKFYRRQAEVFYLGGFCKVMLKHANAPIQFRIYSSNKLKIHKGRLAKVPYLDTQIGINNQTLYPPINSKRKTAFPKLKLAGKISYSSNQPAVFYVSGAGWFTVDRFCHFEVHTPDGLGFFPVYGHNFLKSA